jgi:hypothetical protein
VSRAAIRARFGPFDCQDDWLDHDRNHAGALCRVVLLFLGYPVL